MATAQEKESENGLLINIFNRPVLTPILGFIAADAVKLDERKPSASNNTRWIFDVEHGCDAIVVQLLEPRTKKPLKPELMSISLLPRSLSFYEAKPFVEHIAGGSFTIHHAEKTACSYRVAVDVLHSATR